MTENASVSRPNACRYGPRGAYTTHSIPHSQSAPNQVQRLLLAGRILLQYDEDRLIVGCLFEGDVCMETEVSPETAKAWLWDFSVRADAVSDPMGDLVFLRDSHGWKVQRRRWRDGQTCRALFAISDSELGVFVNVLKDFCTGSHACLALAAEVGDVIDWPPMSVFHLS